MYCRNCGNRLPDNSRFCGNCGTSVSQSNPKNSVGSKREIHTPKRGGMAAVFRILRWIVIGAVLFGIILVISEKADERRIKKQEELLASMRSTEPTLSPEESALAERLPDVPEHLRSVQALQSRGVGSCKELAGNVAVTVVFVDDTVSSWTQTEIDEFTNDLYASIADLTHQAAQWNVALSITLHTCHSTIEYEVPPESASNDLGPILSRAGYNMYGLSDALKNKYSAEAVPIVIAFNKEGRSYAMLNDREDQIEACYLFSGSDAFNHELLHLFGAADFYYHGLMDFGASDVLGDSIMGDSATDRVDDLTAYLVGWTDELTNEAETMLYLLGYIGNEELNKALGENMLTGFGTMTNESGNYNGNLVMGVPHGWGIMEFFSGDVYAGEFDNGAITGYGCFTWANGDCYEGDFQAGQLHGYGTLTKANGEVFTGRWENSTFIG